MGVCENICDTLGKKAVLKADGQWKIFVFQPLKNTKFSLNPEFYLHKLYLYHQWLILGKTFLTENFLIGKTKQKQPLQKIFDLKA